MTLGAFAGMAREGGLPERGRPAEITLGMAGRRLRYADLIAATGTSPLPEGEPFYRSGMG